MRFTGCLGDKENGPPQGDEVERVGAVVYENVSVLMRWLEYNIRNY